MCLIFHGTSNARVQQEGVEYAEERGEAKRSEGEWGGVESQRAGGTLCASPRILKPIIWLNSFCNYPKGSALHTHSKCSTNNSEAKWK